MHSSKIFIIIILAFGTLTGANAQSFIDRLKTHKQGEGTVVVRQSKAIDELVNGKSAAPVATNNHSASKPKGNASSTQTEKPKANKPATAASGKKNPAETSVGNATEVDAGKKVIRNGHKVTGYRVQVFTGRNSREDKKKASDVGARLKTLFPDQPIYVHFYNPRWICRMGNFRSYDDAQTMLNAVKAIGYKQACIVKGQITVQD